jgi:hypothetical protein
MPAPEEFAMSYYLRRRKFKFPWFALISVLAAMIFGLLLMHYGLK